MLAKPRPLDRIVDVEAGIAAEAAGSMRFTAI